MPKPPIYSGQYHRTSAALRAAAYADPSTVCWRCGRTLGQIRTEHPRATWTAGHLVDGQVGGQLAAECSPCNYGHGGRARKRKRGPLAW